MQYCGHTCLQVFLPNFKKSVQVDSELHSSARLEQGCKQVRLSVISVSLLWSSDDYLAIAYLQSQLKACVRQARDTYECYRLIWLEHRPLTLTSIFYTNDFCNTLAKPRPKCCWSKLLSDAGWHFTYSGDLYMRFWYNERWNCSHWQDTSWIMYTRCY